jgi:hypothetical protein
MRYVVLLVAVIVILMANIDATYWWDRVSLELTAALLILVVGHEMGWDAKAKQDKSGDPK